MHTEITLTNPNRSPLSVAGVTSSDGALTRVDGGSCGASVPGGGRCNLWVRFAPQRLGPHATTLTVTSTGVGPASVDLTGTGVVQLVVMVAKGFSAPADAVTVSGAGNCGGGCTATISESPVTLTARPVPIRMAETGSARGVSRAPAMAVRSLELSRDQTVVVTYDRPPLVRVPG